MFLFVFTESTQRNNQNGTDVVDRGSQTQLEVKALMISTRLIVLYNCDLFDPAVLNL